MSSANAKQGDESSPSQSKSKGSSDEIVVNPSNYYNPFLPAVHPMEYAMMHPYANTNAGATTSSDNNDTTANDAPVVPSGRGRRESMAEHFPSKLHRMLEACERDGLSKIASFFPHGRAFAIHQPRRFAEEVMPKHFKQTKYTSFQRQLNLYGFRRLSLGPDVGGYYHERFLKGQPQLSVGMKRTKLKGDRRVKSNSSNEFEPNFYAFPPLESVMSNRPGGANMMPVGAIPFPMYTMMPMGFGPSSGICGGSGQHPMSSVPYPMPPFGYPFPFAGMPFYPPQQSPVQTGKSKSTSPALTESV